MNASLFTNIVIVLVLSVAAMFICLRAKIPTIIGLLAVGIISGPSGAGLIGLYSEVEIVAEIGVVLLMFSIGLEFSLKELMHIKRSVLINGSMQVISTAGITFLVFRWGGMGAGEAMFIGMLVSLSSTAVVLKVLQDRTEMDSLHGRSTLAVLIFQDLAVVPMMLLLPLLAGTAVGEADTDVFIFLILKAVLAVVIVIISARWLVPFILYRITSTRSRELFILSIVALCTLVTWLTYKAGLSLALGAFLAGLIISESEYSHQALSNIIPFKDVFTGFFFISIGMLIDIRYVMHKPLEILFLSAGVLVVKSLVVVFNFSLLGLPLRVGLLCGAALCQIGEFSFVLAKAGMPLNLLSPENYQAFLGVATITMMATPVLISVAPLMESKIMKLPLPGLLKRGYMFLPDKADGLKNNQIKNHMIIVGYGINGKNVAKAAAHAGIPYIIIEMNPDTVREESNKGEKILYGDAAGETILRFAGITDARIIVITVADAPAARRTTAIARQLNPGIHIITRTRFMGEVEPLRELGANDVVPEEFETAVEIFSRVLKNYLVPRNEILKLVNDIRSSTYSLFRNPVKKEEGCADLSCYLPGMDISTLLVEPGSFLSGKTLSDLDIRKRFEITVLAIKTRDSIVPNPTGETTVSPGDVLVLMSASAGISRLLAMDDPDAQGG